MHTPLRTAEDVMQTRILPLSTPDEAERCARLMSTSEPWITLERSYEASLRILTDEIRVLCGR